MRRPFLCMLYATNDSLNVGWDQLNVSLGLDRECAVLRSVVPDVVAVWLSTAQ